MLQTTIVPKPRLVITNLVTARALSYLRRHLWKVLVVAALAIAGGILLLRQAGAEARTTSFSADQLAVVGRGSVSVTVSATGSIVAARQARQTIGQTGRLDDLPVKVGDRVHAGQPLARLNTDGLQARLDQARSQLAQAQTKLQQLTADSGDADASAAQAAYDAAVAKYDELANGPTPADLGVAETAVAQAQSALIEAQAKLQALVTAGASERSAAEAAVTQAESALSAAQAKLDDINAGAAPEDLAAAQAGVQQANDQFKAAETRLQASTSGAQANVASAQNAVDQAQAQVTSTRAKLDQVKAAVAIPADVAAAQADLASAAAKLQASYQDLDQLEAQLAAEQATLASEQSMLSAGERSADAVCGKLGSSSPECSNARSKVDQLGPQILQTGQKVKLLQGSGSWEHLAARKNLEAAQAAYAAAAAHLKQTEAARPVGNDLISSQSAYDAAVSALTNARIQADQAKVQAQTDVATAQLAVDEARAGVVSAQAKLTNLERGAANADRVAAQTALETAQANLAAARARLEALVHPAIGDVQTARAAVTSAAAGLASAKAKLDQVRHGPSAADIAAARSTVANAQAALEARTDRSARNSDITIQQEVVRQAQLTVAQAQQALDGTTMTAPFDGVVVGLGCNVGEQVPCGATPATNAVVTLVDPGETRVEVGVNESDIAKLAAGQSARVSFDAIPAQDFAATLQTIVPNGTVSQGVVTYPVVLSIDTGGRALPAGLTASASITVDERIGALVVPSVAIRRQGQVQLVEVVDPSGGNELRQVRTGLSDDESVEVTAGLEEGQVVVIASPADAATAQRQGNT